MGKELINETLRKNGIHVPLADCRGQGYDNRPEVHVYHSF